MRESRSTGDEIPERPIEVARGAPPVSHGDGAHPIERGSRLRRIGRVEVDTGPVRTATSHTRWLVTFCHVGVLALSPLWLEVAQAQLAPNSGDLAMRRVLDLNQSCVGPELIGGKPAPSSEWPASFYSSAADGNCTRTLIGPRTLLLAAHCVGDGKSANIEFGGARVESVCTHATGWPADPSADYALCKLATPVDTLCETVSRDPARLSIGQKLLLRRYGCRKPSTTGIGVPGNDGVFRTGEAVVVALPGEMKPNSIVTRDDVVVCPGDSGGGAYAVNAVAGTRRVVSVNSRVRRRRSDTVGVREAFTEGSDRRASASDCRSVGHPSGAAARRRGSPAPGGRRF